MALFILTSNLKISVHPYTYHPGSCTLIKVPYLPCTCRE